MDEKKSDELSEEIHKELIRIACHINELASKYNIHSRLIADVIVYGIENADYVEGD